MNDNNGNNNKLIIINVKFIVEGTLHLSGFELWNISLNESLLLYWV